jgi:5-methyltetrahydrofolate--homocysteine methyltransferase
VKPRQPAHDVRCQCLIDEWPKAGFPLEVLLSASGRRRHALSLTTRFQDTEFARLLENRGVLVADGGMGTLLMGRGIDPDHAPELWNVEHPEQIAGIHRAYVGAGADIILTNTFGGTRIRLTHRGLADRTEELNRAAVGIARSVADGAERPVLVGGSIGPTGSLFEPFGDLTPDQAEKVFGEQIDALVAAGIDAIWIETMSSIEELTAAHAAASRFDLPAITTMSFDTKGHTMMGVAPAALAEWWSMTESAPFALGANCGIDPEDTVAVVADITEVLPEAVVIAKGNCGLPVLDGVEVRYPVGPDGMAAYARRAIGAGARIIGACCGSTPEHIGVIRETVDAVLTGT